MLYIFITLPMIFYRTLIETIITLYPNPASDRVTLEGVGNKAKVLVINSVGKIVKRLDNVSGSVTFSVADLPKGFYFVRVGTAVRKLVVE